MGQEWNRRSAAVQSWMGANLMKEEELLPKPGELFVFLMLLR
jgi:hypothetical protein